MVDLPVYKRSVVLFYLFIILVLLQSISVHSQNAYDRNKKFTPALLQEDLSVLKNVLEKIHVGLYRYTSKSLIDSLFSNCLRQLDKPLTEIEFFRLLSPIVVAIRDEHSFVLPSEIFWKTEIGTTVYSDNSSDSKSKLFPFFVKIIDNRLFIENNLSEDTTLKPGNEIVTIDNKSISEVLGILLPTIPTNGLNETFRLRHLEQYSLNQTYNRFIVHYALFISQPDSFKLSIKKDGTPAKEIKVAALPFKSIFNNYWRRYSTTNDLKKRKENPLECNFLAGNVAYLRLSDFHTNIWAKYNYSYSTEYKTFFNAIRIKNTLGLIIDLRGNEGGNPAIGIELLQYLCTTTFQPYLYHEVKDYKFDSLKKYFRDSTEFPKYADELFIPSGHETFKSNPLYKTEVWSRSMQPSPLCFNGKLYVLVNGATGSAASILATLIRVNRLDAIFIGEECGGDMEGPVSGSGTDINLPNTRIRVDVPYVRRFINLNGYPYKKGQSVSPDYAIKPPVDDLIDNEDGILKYALRLVTLNENSK